MNSFLAFKIHDNQCTQRCHRWLKLPAQKEAYPYGYKTWQYSGEYWNMLYTKAATA